MITSAKRLHGGAQAPPVAAPIVKWAGSKRRLVGQLLPMLPPSVEGMRHVEPFAGGLALFFSRAPQRALIGDINPELITLYRAVREDVDAVIGHLRRLARAHSRARYYEVRARFNDSILEERALVAAMFIYLNRTCFNGLYRVNRRGEFNVPIGRYVRPRIVDEGGLRAASTALARADIRCADFAVTVDGLGPGDFVYVDPPYAPTSRTSNFAAYTAHRFGASDHVRLRDQLVCLDRAGCLVMASNSDTPMVRELYGDRFRLDTVSAPRAINCQSGGRGRVTELVICNY